MKETQTNISIPKIKEHKNKYRLIAEQIYSQLGENNYSNVFNCMTRFRVQITNKDLVNLEEIKKIPIVKGTVWAGNQLQIIIGGEVVKVVDEFKKYELELENKAPKSNDNYELKVAKLSVGKRFMTFLSSVISPFIAMLIAVGMFNAIYSLLTLPNGNNLLQTSVQVDGKPVAIGMGNINLFDVWSALFYILTKITLNGLGMFFIYQTVTYFKGNRIFAIAIGMTLMSRAFFPVGGVNYADAGFGDWTSNLNKTGFLLFKLGDFPIVVGGYEGSILPYIFGGIAIVLVDKWVKSWMPTVIDIVFRATLVYLIVIFGLWFILGPIASLIEFGLIKACTTIINIPWFGVAFVSFIRQPLVLTGMHPALSASFMPVLADVGHTAYFNCVVIATFSQTGAVIGVALKTKNSNLRRIAWGTVPAGIFGVTEPAIYGVNLQKMRPFLLALVGAFVAGLFSGAFNLEATAAVAGGIFSILAFPIDGFTTSMVLLSWVISVGVSLGLTWLFYVERADELNTFKHSISKLVKLVKGDKTLINKEFEEYELEIKNKKSVFKDVESYYSESSKYENKLVSIENQENKNIEKMYSKLTKLRNRLMKKENQNLLNKFNELNNKYSIYNLDDEKNEISSKLDNLNKTKQNELDTFNKWKTKVYDSSIHTLNNYRDDSLNLEIDGLQNKIWNALNSVEVGYGIEDARPTKFKKKEL